MQSQIVDRFLKTIAGFTRTPMNDIIMAHLQGEGLVYRGLGQACDTRLDSMICK